MQHAHWLVFIGSLLLLGGILAGMLSSRIGAPLLLAFLGLGMAAGPDGFGLRVHDTGTAYLIGSTALSLILFDGGLHTRQRVFRLALGPASVLATFGVVLTAGITALAARWFLHLDWLRSGLIGAIVSSTDAAAVFLLLHQRGRDISARVAATLETEAGFNDPVAVFLTVTLVAAMSAHGTRPAAELALFLLRQGVLGLVLGVAGGFAIAQLVNRMQVSAGLYPILVMAGAVCIFGGTQLLDGSGYLAIYLAGLVCGNSRLRSSQMITRFHEAMAWLAQLVLFIMLGLMVVPSHLLPALSGALGVALVLTVVARPLAVWLCLTPFGFTGQERLFIAWVGLRGAVPIFLAMIPHLAGVPHSDIFFDVAFITVLASLLLQGWTVAPAAHWLRLDVPGEPVAGQRLDLEIAAHDAREISAWRVAPGSPALDRDFDQLHMPEGTRVIAVLRDGMAVDHAHVDRLHPADVVLALAPEATVEAADRLFSPRAAKRNEAATLGDFVLDPAVPMATLVDLYGLPGTLADRAKPLGTFLRERLGRAPVIGDRLHLGLVDLIVRKMENDRIAEIGVVLEPERIPLEGVSVRRRIRHAGRMLLRRLSRRRAV
jgi:cell volume regulation protein A